MLTLLLAAALLQPVPVERVLALVNGVPVLASDVEVAELADLVPRRPGEDDAEYRRAILDALIDLELRWQDLQAAAVAERTAVDVDAAIRALRERVGGADLLRARLDAAGLDDAALRELVRRAAVVQAYVVARFAPFVHPSQAEIEDVWQRELAPELVRQGKVAPPLGEVRTQVEALVRERKLASEIDRWTAELRGKGEVVRYSR